MLKEALDINNLDFCTGCKMCADLCPVNAISYVDNGEGFWYPQIDESRCIDCGLCKRRCPALKTEKEINEFTPEVYSAATKDSDIRDLSTSGGIFGELGRYIISIGGVVVGSVYSDDYKSAYHTFAETEEELKALIGTKYFQSDTAEIYAKTKEYLENGRSVLFCGTPCQNAGLKAYLNTEYDNLYQMDFICNSISSPKVHKKGLDELEKLYGSKISKVRSKDKKEGWAKLNTVIYFENGAVRRQDRYNNPLNDAFIKYNLYQRKCCYKCNFRGTPNYTADITVGDFWGLKDLDYYDWGKGVSAVIINTPKGDKLFGKIRKNLTYKKRTLEEVKKGNPRLTSDPQYHAERETFLQALDTNPMNACVELSTGLKVKKKKTDKFSIKELREYAKIKKFSTFKYIYLNFFSKNIIRTGTAKIIPLKGAIFDFHKSSKFILRGDENFWVGPFFKKKPNNGSYIRLGKNAIMELYRGGAIECNTMIEVQDNAKFTSGYFSFNVGSTLICQKNIKFGDTVMCGRNVMILDSDFHQLRTFNGRPTNPPMEVEIKDHVWLTGDCKVTAGSKIGHNCIVEAYSVIKGEIPSWSVVHSGNGIHISKLRGNWSNASNAIIYENVNSKGDYRQILVGFGKLGKEYYQKQEMFIDYVVDNSSKDQRAISFEEFCRQCPQIEKNQIFVIGSRPYFDELKGMVLKEYPDAKIAFYGDIFGNDNYLNSEV